MFNTGKDPYATRLAMWLTLATLAVFAALANALSRMTLTWS
jgi:hypothetical protein